MLFSCTKFGLIGLGPLWPIIRKFINTVLNRLSTGSCGLLASALNFPVDSHYSILLTPAVTISGRLNGVTRSCVPTFS